MRLSLRAAIMLLFVCFGLSHALAEKLSYKPELPYDRFRNACAENCSKSGNDKDYCTPYCECFIDGLKASGDETEQTAIVIHNKPAFLKINLTCGGKLGLVRLVKTCKANCQGAACSHCDCLLNEVKALGDDFTIGAFFKTLELADPASTSHMSAWQAKCSK